MPVSPTMNASDPAEADAELEARIEELNSHIHHSRYAEAAALAAQLWDGGARDVRVLGPCYFGPFLAKGAAALPGILESVLRSVGPELPDLGPARKKNELLDSTLGWLFGALHKQLTFAHQDQGGKKVLAVDPALRRPLRDALAQTAPLERELANLVKRPRSLAALQRLVEVLRALNESVGPEPPPAPAPPPKPVAPEAAVPTAPPTALVPAAPVAPALPPVLEVAPRAGGDVIQLEATAALRLLLRKLAAFATLIEREDFQRAAVVVRDLQEAIEDFDPREYFPQLFSTYSGLLAVHMEALEPFLDGQETRSVKALQQLYQVDLDRFLKGAK